MTGVTALTVVADNANKSPDGALGLLVFLCVAAVVALLLRSMVGHLKKVDRMRIEERTSAMQRSTASGGLAPSATEPPAPRDGQG